MGGGEEGGEWLVLGRGGGGGGGGRGALEFRFPPSLAPILPKNEEARGGGGGSSFLAEEAREDEKEEAGATRVSTGGMSEPLRGEYTMPAEGAWTTSSRTRSRLLGSRCLLEGSHASGKPSSCSRSSAR